jgi:predicted nucleotidyltransferase
MRLASPASALLGENDTSLLLELYRRAEPLSGRQLAANAGVPLSTAQRTLARYADAGIVRATPAAHATLYELNRGHVLADAIFELLAAPAKVSESIGEIVRRRAGDTVTTALFGSAARGDDTSESDLDILLVTPDNFPASEIDELRQEIETRVESLLGRQAQVLDFDRNQFAHMVETHDPLIDALERDADTIVGTDLRALVEAAR